MGGQLANGRYHSRPDHAPEAVSGGGIYSPVTGTTNRDCVRGLDGIEDLARPERLDQEIHGLCRFRSLDGRRVGKAGEENDRHMVLRAKRSSDFDPVHRADETNIDESERWRALVDQPQRLPTGGRYPGNGEA